MKNALAEAVETTKPATDNFPQVGGEREIRVNVVKIIESIMTNNPCYKAGRKITVKGLMLHSVGCPQPKASVFINSWNNAAHTSSCVHGFIDANDGAVYQTLPWDHRGWHCGSGSKGSANNTHIGIEMCEPGCISYTGGSSFTCSDKATAKACVERTYRSAVELFAMLCKKFNLSPTADGVIVSHKEGNGRGIASNHGDPEHLWTGLGMSYTMDGFRADVKKAMGNQTSSTKEKPLTASDLKGLNPEEVIKRVGPLFTADMKKSGILASVSLTQFCLESGFGTSELALNANNCFGMKTNLSGNNWPGSAWDGKSKYTKKTGEQKADGQYYTVTADFRKYGSIAESIADHSAYLTGAKNGSKLRYAGLKGCTNYQKAFQIIKDGGYATAVDYVSKLCKIVEKWDLTKYDISTGSGKDADKTVYYRVRKEWSKPDTQIGAFTVLKNAKNCVNQNPGYKVFDESGKQVYPKEAAGSQKSVDVPFKVKVSAPDLNIRNGAGTNFSKTGKYTGVGIFTIIETKSGPGSKSGWGLLKSKAGWISLDYCTKL